MSTETIYEMQSGSSDATVNFGKKLGRNLRGGEVIELRSDVGGGKTTLTKGIVEGAGSEDVVSSPSFTLSKQYHAKTFSVHHFDLYRLGEAGIVGEMLEEVAYDPSDVLIIEWADVAESKLPSPRLVIELSKKAEDERLLVCRVPHEYDYIFEGISL